jgi:hypothetical protein
MGAGDEVPRASLRWDKVTLVNAEEITTEN